MLGIHAIHSMINTYLPDKYILTIIIVLVLKTINSFIHSTILLFYIVILYSIMYYTHSIILICIYILTGINKKRITRISF